MILRFEEWLTAQQYREDLVGDLARVPHMQKSHPHPGRKIDEHKNWADIVIGMAEPGHTAVFNEAWQEYLLAKQAAKEKESLD
jgi:hypothetical protein